MLSKIIINREYSRRSIKLLIILIPSNCHGLFLFLIRILIRIEKRRVLTTSVLIQGKSDVLTLLKH